MTYNFDPDRWYDNEAAALALKLRRGTLSKSEFEAAMDELNRRYGEMLDRLDGTYRIPGLGDG
jgi:hypothetical protein